MKMKKTKKKIEPLNDEMDDYLRKQAIKDFEFDDYGVMTLFTVQTN